MQTERRQLAAAPQPNDPASPQHLSPSTPSSRKRKTSQQPIAECDSTAGVTTTRRRLAQCAPAAASAQMTLYPAQAARAAVRNEVQWPSITL
jgi:hypothetical protein